MLNLVQLKYLKQYLSKLSKNDSNSYIVLTKSSKLKKKKRVSKSILNNFNSYLNIPGIKYVIFESQPNSVLESEPVKILYQKILFDKVRFERALESNKNILKCFSSPIYQIIKILNERKRFSSN
jgi:hypothetical protein